jgi:hypothetical protein
MELVKNANWRVRNQMSEEFAILLVFLFLEMVEIAIDVYYRRKKV